jgi:hypothetical protein
MDTAELIDQVTALQDGEKLIIRLRTTPSAEQLDELGKVLEHAAPGRWLVLAPDVELVKIKAGHIADVIDIVAGHCRSAIARDELREKATAIREHGWSGV